MDFKSSHVQRLFDVSAETVRNWSDEFQKYLSVTATPGSGRHRLFTIDDMEVFALVAELKEKGMVYADIHAALDNGQRGEVPPTLIEQVQDLHLAMKVDQAQDAIARIQSDRDAALAQLQSLHDENIRLQTRLEVIEEVTSKRIEDSHKRVEGLERELEKARDEVKQLTSELGYLRGRTELKS